MVSGPDLDHVLRAGVFYLGNVVDQLETLAVQLSKYGFESLETATRYEAAQLGTLADELFRIRQEIRESHRGGQ